MSTIAQNLQTIATAKANIATSINNKGGSVTSSTPLSAYSAAIDAIPSGGGGGVPDWSEIGYSTAPQYILDGHAYAKTIYDNWDDTQVNLNNKFKNDTQLRYFPLVDTSNATIFQSMLEGCSNLEYIPLIDTSKATNMVGVFRDCSKLTTVSLIDMSNVTSMSLLFYNCTSLTTVPQFNTSACTDMSNMFQNCSNLASVPQFDTSKVESMQHIFNNCSSLTTIPQLNTSACTNMQYMFNGCSGLTTVPQLNTSACTQMNYMFTNCKKLEKIEGLDLTSVTNISNFFGFSNITTLRYALFKNLGTTSGLTSYDFSKATVWGVADSTYTDARQSLVDSLLTYSFDRATAGYSTCTIKLHSNSKNQLTAQEISDIEAKGYTITT